MIWLTWRQFRAQAASALAIMAAAATYLLITGIQLHHAFAGDLAACAPRHDCGDALGRLGQLYHGPLNLAQLLVIATPGLIGIFWGAPLIAHEIETGTDQVAWNQSVTRSRWLSIKLAGVGLAALGTTAILSYLLTWWAGPLDHLDGGRFAAVTFSSRDIVPIAYAVFAFALGTTAGLLLRRTIPAMAVTLAAFVGIQILVPTLIRPDLLPSTTITLPISPATASQFSGVSTGGGGAEIRWHAGTGGRLGDFRAPGAGLRRPGGHRQRARELPFPRRAQPRHEERGPAGRASRRLSRALPPAPERYLSARESLLAAAVVRIRDLPRPDGRADRHLVLADPAPPDLTDVH